jgi:hypothetical protein
MRLVFLVQSLMLNSSPRDIVGAPPPDSGPRDADLGLVIGVDDSPPWELSIEAGLDKPAGSSGQAVMFDHGGEAVTRVVF